ncbi:nucleotidyltransferase [Gracilibacillus caseinilyticus]|uniref:Nucleotidyltransferase n=1 Tax=Gracilibacillus caseinilyticus TaxID=2932256 RepID=A0ABY4EXL3_9BACI|nr:nucleotidyltransferase [Gracilibacillus caseinilyticus]UOQ49024.1 nucleotidyltransferase [Gracilibacillus caseinilyticus]
MAEIKNIGRFCLTDTNGYIINDANLKKINHEYYKVIEEVIKVYNKHLKNDLHSIYIRGSIPRGLGIYSISDIDTIAVTTKQSSEIDVKWVDKAEQELNEKYTCVSGIEFSFYCMEDVLETNHFSIIPFMIKTHSVCVFGDDISGLLPDYQADKTLGNEHLVNLREQIELAKEDLKGNEDKEDILDCCRWIMKIIVRAGLALVIEKEHKYTRDLFPAYTLFSTYYPEKEPAMKQAVKYAIEPVEDPKEIVDYLNKMGPWMIEEAEKWLQVHNQKKLRNMTI